MEAGLWRTLDRIGRPAIVEHVGIIKLVGQIAHFEGHIPVLASIAPEGIAEQQDGFITSLRHERCLKESLEALAAARTAIELSIPHEMLLLDLYAALGPIDAITGATTADDILNRIFSTFCIGK